MNDDVKSNLNAVGAGVIVSEGVLIQASLVTGYCYRGEHRLHGLTEVTRLSRACRPISHNTVVITKYRATHDAGAPCHMIWDSSKFYLCVEGLHIAGEWPPRTWACRPNSSRRKDLGGRFFRTRSRVLLSSFLVETPLSSDHDYRDALDRARAGRIYLRS